MIFLRFIFGLMGCISLCLIAFIFSVMKSGTPEVMTAIIYTLIPGICLAICSLCFFSAAKFEKKWLSFFNVGLMLIIGSFTAWVPVGLGLHYHPTENYAGLIALLYGPQILAAVGMIYVIQRHFKNGQTQ